MKHNCLPSVVIQRTRTKHLVTLRHMFASRFGIAKCVRKTCAFNWLLFNARNMCRWFNADQFKKCRHHVDRVQILRSHFAFGGKLLRPVHDQRVGNATFVSFSLPSLERRVTCPGPAPRIMIVCLRRAKQINSFDVFFETFRNEIEIKHFVE